MKKKETIKGYKGFDKNLKCRGYQFEIGKTFEEKGKPKYCNNGFHFCEYPLDVFDHYAPGNSRFCEVEALGDIDKEEENTKVATNKIKIGAEINFESLTKAAINFIYERVNKEETEESTKNKDNSIASNTGYRSVASNTGDSSVASNTGYSSVASNTGEKGIASSIGIEGKAKGYIGTWLVLAEWKLNDDYYWEVKEVKTVIVDGENIKADTLYQLIDGEFVEVEDE